MAQDPDASRASRDIADAVSGTRTYVISRSPAQPGVPNAEVVVAPDDANLTAEVTAIKQRAGRDLGLPGGARTAQTFARLGLIRASVKAYECGITRLTYRPNRSAGQ